MVMTMYVFTYLIHHKQDVTIFQWSTASLNSDFSFSLTCCLTKAKEPSLPYYVHISGRRIDGSMPFLGELVTKQNTNCLRFWTWFTGFYFGLGLVWFYDISSTVDYLMPNSGLTYISNMWLVNTFCTYTQLNNHTVLFLTIQFSINQRSSKYFYV